VLRNPNILDMSSSGCEHRSALPPSLPWSRPSWSGQHDPR